VTRRRHPGHPAWRSEAGNPTRRRPRERPPAHEHDEDLRRVCSVGPGWRAVFLRRRGDGRWVIEPEPVLALVLVRSAIRHGKRHRRLDRVVHSVRGLTPSTLPRFGRRAGELGTAEDDALPDDAFLGYLPPGAVIGEGDRYVRLAEEHVAASVDRLAALDRAVRRGRATDWPGRDAGPELRNGIPDLDLPAYERREGRP
jgi:hypothetical protein